MAEANLPPPSFSEREGNCWFVRITLRNDIRNRKLWSDEDAAAVLGRALFEGLTDNDRRIVNYVLEYDPISVSQAQRLTQYSWPRAKQLLVGLVEKHIFEHVHRT